MKVVIAVDKFKGSLTAAQAAGAVSDGVRRVATDASVVTVPVADGGDGTVAAALAAGFTEVPVTVAGPTGLPVTSAIAVRDRTAVVELATLCGLERLPAGRLAPLTASTHGLGEAMLAAVAAGCDDLVVGVGGSASTDGGAGMLSALGARVLDADGLPVGDGGAELARVARVDLGAARTALAGVSLTLASDVDNPLTGSTGAATVFGPQKGASPDEVEQLDRALQHFADVLDAQSLAGSAGAGAAGGAGFGALLLGADFRSGIEVVLDLVDLDAALKGAELVITGEGSFDEQTLHGKAPMGVAAAAAEHGVPVIALAGRVSIDADAVRMAGFRAAYGLSDLEPDKERCMTNAAPLLTTLSERAVQTWMMESA